jgi:HSP20 family protein
MAETKTDSQVSRSQEQRQGEQRLSRQSQGRAPEGRGMRRWDPGAGPYGSPYEFFNRVSEEMDRWFDQFTRGAGLSRPSFGWRGLVGSQAGEGTWLPRIEAMQKGDTFVVRADLPGLKKDDVEVELTDEAITIRGERREEYEEERGGYWRSEREYGQFHRSIPLPEGVIAESAQATFRDGVLEITMKAAPAEANRGRRVEITEGSGASPQK